jgi:hypothetical protein
MAKRDMTMGEFKKAGDPDGYRDWKINSRDDPHVMRMQFHYMDVVMIFATWKHTIVPSRFDFACQMQMNWSKNVRGTDCPQLMLEHRDPDFCCLLALQSIWIGWRMEKLICRFMFAEGNDDKNATSQACPDT